MWPEPAKSGRWGISGQISANIWLYANSVAYAKRSGFEIVLHTNDWGKELLGFLPYDEIHTTLNRLPGTKSFWAMGKIFAQEAEPVGSIHIDGDVFIKRSDTIDRDRYSKCDFIVQDIEFVGGCYDYNGYIVRKALNNAGRTDLIEMINFGRQSACCCGMVGFNSSALKDTYIAGYKEIYNAVSRDPDYIAAVAADSGGEICPDLVMEQYWLKSIADRSGSKACTMLDYNRRQEDACKIGYAHVIGRQKYSVENRRKAKENLKLLDKILYNKLMEREESWR
jgi:hypothetical protein